MMITTAIINARANIIEAATGPLSGDKQCNVLACWHINKEGSYMNNNMEG